MVSCPVSIPGISIPGRSLPGMSPHLGGAGVGGLADLAIPGRPADSAGAALAPPFPEGFERALFGMGCFWGAERKFWELPGVYSTAVGYAAGYTPNPTYREVCSGATGHSEVVLVVFDPKAIGYADLLRVFWESHDPTPGLRQGNAAATQ